MLLVNSQQRLWLRGFVFRDLGGRLAQDIPLVHEVGDLLLVGLRVLFLLVQVLSRKPRNLFSEWEASIGPRIWGFLFWLFVFVSFGGGGGGGGGRLPILEGVVSQTSCSHGLGKLGLIGFSDLRFRAAALDAGTLHRKVS